MIHRRDTLAIMKAHRHLRLVWPPPTQQVSHSGRSIAVMGPPGAGKTAIVAALVGELLWRDQRLVLVDTAAASKDSLRAWVEAGRPGIFDDVPLICRSAKDGARAAVEAVAKGGAALVDVGHDLSFESAAAICRTVRLTIYLRRRSNDHDGETVTAKALEALYPRRGFKVLYNGLTREDSLRALRKACCGSGIGSFGVALTERVAYRTGRHTGKPPAFQGEGARTARSEVVRLADAIDRHVEHISMLDRWQAEQARPAVD